MPGFNSEAFMIWTGPAVGRVISAADEGKANKSRAAKTTNGIFLLCDRNGIKLSAEVPGVSKFTSPSSSERTDAGYWPICEQRNRRARLRDPPMGTFAFRSPYSRYFGES